MTTTRHRATARLAARLGKLPHLAVVSSVATATVVAVGVAAAPSPDSVQASQLASNASAAAPDPADLAKLAESRELRATRTLPRVELKPKAVGHKFASAPLNIWAAPRELGRTHGLIEEGTKIAVTGQTIGHWAEVLLKDGKTQVVRWVNADYLVKNKPQPEPVEEVTSTGSTESSAPTTGGTCTNGTSVSGAPGVIEIHQAVCANWPEITSYGTYRADSGDHGSGRAIDIMISGDTGWAVAEFVRANASSFGVSYVIYSQKIWSVDRASEGWRYMEDRGSTTANHYDHVHVSVY